VIFFLHKPLCQYLYILKYIKLTKMNGKKQKTTDNGFEEKSPMGASYNMAVAYVERLNELIKDVNYSARLEDLHTWKANLECLYRNLYPKLSDEERIEGARLIKELMDLDLQFKTSNPHPKGDIENKFYLRLHETDLKLQLFMENHKLIMPDKDDPRFAMGTS